MCVLHIQSYTNDHIHICTSMYHCVLCICVYMLCECVFLCVDILLCRYGIFYNILHV